MYESEANGQIDLGHGIPADVIQRFGELSGSVLARTTLPWSEHCTECVWPTCYSTCDLYSAREDGRCRRFAEGMVRVDCPTATNSYLLKIQFKRWGKLWSPANLHLVSAEQAAKMEKRDYRIGTILYNLPAPSKVKSAAIGMRYKSKKRVASRPVTTDRMPTSFLLECYNSEPSSVRLSLTLRSSDQNRMVPFQKLIELGPGFHRVRVPVEEISRSFDLHHPFDIELIPNDVEKLVTLYFGLMEFVFEKMPAHAEMKIKCVVWDLDNTLWSGVLVEDGREMLTLKPGVRNVIRQLDDRGILQSIASKNSHEDAMEVLKRFELDEYFLCPQISWRPKSEAIAEIGRQLNLGIDSVLFIDDSEFELEQVKTTHPELRVINAAQYLSLPQMSACEVPVTEESKERRRMYKTEAARQVVADGFADDYMAFLRHCNIRLTIGRMKEDSIDRVHELTQRTNQMNFSGNRYDRSFLTRILATPHLNTYVLSCDDRFGSYGIVGFSIVDVREPRMTDLMFSCRVQSKRVEHAFLGYIIKANILESPRDFFANYRKTSRNAPSGKVFDDFGMVELKETAGVKSLVFKKEMKVPDDGVIEVVSQEALVGQSE